MKEYDLWLDRQTEIYNQGCIPILDSNREAINCSECNNKECESWDDWNEDEPDFSIEEAEQREANYYGD